MNDKKTISFFLPMASPPTVTHQEKKIGVRNGKPYTYEPPKLAATRSKFNAMLLSHAPEDPFDGPVRLMTKWLYPKGKHQENTYKPTKPDTDNSLKLFKDCMTRVGFWNDDAQVASEITEKFWSDTTGIWVYVEELHDVTQKK